ATTSNDFVYAGAVDEPRRRFDPLALTVMAAAVAALVGITSFLIYRLRTDPQAAQQPAQQPAADDSRLRDAIADVRKWIEESPRPAPPVAVKPPLPPRVLGPAP